MRTFIQFIAAVSFLATFALSFKHKNLTIGVIYPQSGSWAGGQGCLPAIEMALADLNENKDVLHDYRLNMEFNDSQCQPGLGTKVLYELLYNKPTKMMVLTGCSIVSTFVAQAAKMWNLIVLGYGSSSPALSNRERFPTFFRTHPSATLHNPTRIKLFQKFKWNRIGTIQETQEVFTSTIEDLEERVKQANIEVVVRQNFLTDPENAVRNLKRQDARIIVGVFYENMARKVFCQAYKEKLYGKKYVWFIIGWYPDNWYTKSDPKINCTSDQLKEALEGHFTTEAVVLHQEYNVKTRSGMTSQLFKRKIDQTLQFLNYTDTSQVVGYPEAPLAYDAVWALALALDKTSNKLKERGSSLEHFQYDRTDITQEILSAMNETHFLGVSGNVAFSSQGDRIAWTQIEQMINGTYYKRGYYHYNSDNLTWFGNEKWIGGKPPPDQTLIVQTARVISVGLFLTMCSFAALGIGLGFACLIFNTVNRNRRCIRHSQPVINNITVLGSILCLLCVFLFGLDNQFIHPELYSVVCQLRAWLLSVGFSFGYGGMFSKIWTVHRIITADKKDRKVVQTCEMYTVLLVIFLMDIAVLTSWQITDPLRRDLKIFDDEEPSNTNNDVKMRPHLELCTSSNISIWLGVMFGYKGILLLFGIFLAYETRSVKIKQVNDSRFVGMSIYNVVVLCVITAPITLIISTQQDAKFAFLSLAILLSAFLSMGLIFAPKISEIMRNPKKNTLEVRTIFESYASREEEERHEKLLTENEELKQQIAQMEERVKTLNEKLKEKSKERYLMSIHGERNNITSSTENPSYQQYTSSHDPSVDNLPQATWLAKTNPVDHLILLTEPSSDSGLPVSNEHPNVSE